MRLDDSLSCKTAIATRSAASLLLVRVLTATVPQQTKQEGGGDLVKVLGRTNNWACKPSDRIGVQYY